MANGGWGGGVKKSEWWWTFEHFYMPEGIPLTTLIKVIIGAIGACQMPSLPSQLPSSPWTQLHTLWRGLGGRREARPAVCRGNVLTIWNMSSFSISRHMQDGHMKRLATLLGGPGFQTHTRACLYTRSRWLIFYPLRRARSARSVVSHN